MVSNEERHRMDVKEHWTTGAVVAPESDLPA
jgi:hypothetical protein